MKQYTRNTEVDNSLMSPTPNRVATLADFPAIKLPNGQTVEHRHRRQIARVCALCALTKNADAHAAQERGRVLAFAPRKRPRPAPRRTTDHDGGDRKVAA